MAERERGVLDTSVVIDIDLIDSGLLQKKCAIATITLSGLSAGIHSVADSSTRAARQEILQYVESAFQAVPFDSEAARAGGRIYNAVLRAGRKPRGGSAVDFLIAATALSRGLPLVARNPSDFDSLEELMDIVTV